MALLIEPARPRMARELRAGPWLAVAAVCLGAFMGQLDASIVTVAFPAMQRGFGATLAAVQWVSLAYLLALVAVLVPVGRLSDASGHKLMYLYGFVVFTAGSGACCLAWSLPALIGLRVVQAIGAAMLQANSVALVVTSVGAARARAALGAQAAAQALGLALGPTVGGVLVSSVGWRWVFGMNVPVGIVAVVAGWVFLPRTRHRAPRAGRDPIGSLLLAVASTAVLLAVSGVSGLRLPMVVTLGLVALAVAAALVLPRWERRTREPLLDSTLLAHGYTARGVVGALGAYLVLFGPLVLLPQALATVAGAARIGIVLTALPAGFATAALGVELPRSPRWGNRLRCLAGGVLAAVAAAGLAAMFGLGPPRPGHGAVTTGTVVVLLALLGVGLGTYIPANNARIMEEVPESMASTAGGMINMARGIGTALGVAEASLMLYFFGSHRLGPGMSMGILSGCALLIAAPGLGRSRQTPR